MAEDYHQPYLDSSAFIAWVRREVRGDVDRGQIISHILDQAKRGRFVIHTSTWTLAEVHKRRADPECLQPKQDDDLLAFFEQPFIRLIEVDRRIGEEANRLCRQYDLAPSDAIHLACALRAGCDVLLAWDAGLTQVKHPKIRVEEPQILGQAELPLA